MLICCARYQLQYVASEFRGLLPKPYEAVNGTSAIPTHMNNLNQEQPERYVRCAMIAEICGSLLYQIPVESCHYLIDVDTPVTAPREPRYLETGLFTVRHHRLHFRVLSRNPRNAG